MRGDKPTLQERTVFTATDAGGATFVFLDDRSLYLRAGCGTLYDRGAWCWDGQSVVVKSSAHMPWAPAHNFIQQAYIAYLNKQILG